MKSYRQPSRSAGSTATVEPEAADFGSNQARAGEVGAPAPSGSPFLEAAAGEVGALGDTHEHIGVGGDHPVVIHTVEFTTGQISSLPDFVPSIEVLYQIEAPRLREIRTALERKMADPHSVDDAEWMRLFGKVYAELTFDNANHFGTIAGMNGDLEGTNIGTWATHHEMASELALQSYQSGDPALGERAIATEAFGAHFLADAFSSGHLFDKGAAVADTAETGAVLRKLLIGLAAGDVFDAHGDMIAKFEVCDLERNWRPFERQTFGGLMLLADVVKPQGFENAPAGAIHDVLSAQGVPVRNDVDEWRMFGDERMKDDPKSAMYATEATERGHLEIEDLVQTGIPTSQDVLGLVPRPTEEGEAQVEETVAHFQSDAGMLEALVQQLGKQIETILDGAVESLPWFVRRIDPTGREPEHERPEPEVPGPRIPEGELPGECLQVYTVQPGDWLSTIAAELYGDPQQYRVLYEANRDPVIEGFTDPDRIEPGWELVVPRLPDAPAP